MAGSLSDRAKRLSIVREHLNETSLAIDRGGFFHQPEANEFLQAWLRPQHDPSQWVARAGTDPHGPSVQHANRRVLEVLGQSVYDAAEAATKPLDKQPYQYGEIIHWVDEEHQALLEPLRHALEEMGRKLLNETLRVRRKIAGDLETLSADLSMIGVQHRFVQNASLYLTLRQACPIVLVEGLAQRFAAAGTGEDETLSPGQFVQQEEWQKLSWWKECNMPPPPGPPHWSEQPWSSQAPSAPMYRQAQQLVLEHLGARTAAEGRMRLMAQTPALGFIDRMFSVSGLISALLQPLDAQLTSFQRMLGQVRQRIAASNEAFAAEVANVTRTQWTRYAPLIRFVSEALVAEGYDSSLVEAARDLLIAPARTPGWSDHLALVFTIAGVALAFFPPLTAVGVGTAVLGSALGVGVKVKEYRDTLSENEARRQLAYGQPAAADALRVIEDPARTDLVEQALLIELVFAATTVIPVARSAGRLVSGTQAAPVTRAARLSARERQIAEVVGEREQLVAQRGRVSTNAQRAAEESENVAGARRMVDRDRSLASGNDRPRRGNSATEPETPASRAITNEQRGLVDTQRTRNELIIQRDRAEREVQALTDLESSAADILKFSDQAPTAREYRQLVEKRQRYMEHLRHLDPDDVKHRRALLITIVEDGEKIQAYETLRQARLRLPAMRSNDADQLIIILRQRDAARLRAQRHAQKIQSLQIEIQSRQQNLARLKEELTDVSENLGRLQRQQERVVAQLEEQREILEFHIRQKSEEETMLRRLVADAAKRAQYISTTAGGAAFLEELAKRGLETNFAGGQMAPEIDLYLPSWFH